MKITVIIAAYNAEKYLKETMDSIVNQSLGDFEVIVINDGSTDNTLEILRGYEKRYAHVKVLDKENGGPSSARNMGLEHATGEYIYFFDSDDVLEEEALEALYERAELCCADLVIGKYDIFDKNGTTSVNNLNEIVMSDDIERYDRRLLWTFSLCNKLFKRELIEKLSLRFEPISYSEDGVFTMTCIFNSEKIVGLDKIIFHYRRMFDGETTSITSSVSPKKIEDYITAHRLIYNAAVKSILRDFSEYHSENEIKEKDEELCKYLNEILCKELQILFNQFYSKFWSIDEKTVNLITDEVNEKMRMLDMKSIFRLIDAHPELSLYQLPVTRKELVDQALITVILYSDDSEKEDFLKCLNSLVNQKMVAFRVIASANMEAVAKENNLMQDGISYVEAESQNEMYVKAFPKVRTPYVLFADPKFTYANDAFMKTVKFFAKSVADFTIEVIYHRDYGDIQPVFLSSWAYNSHFSGMHMNAYACMDHTLANKFFRVEYLQEVWDRFEGSLLEFLPKLYNTGYYAFKDTGSVIYERSEDSYIEYTVPEEEKEFVQLIFKENPADLRNKELEVETKEFYRKAQLLSMKTIPKRIFKKIVSFLSMQPCKDQVLFFTIRKDGELEGNAKALYPYIKGKKIIYAKRLPHDKFTELKIFYYIFTSKVIITDDYVKYLRYVKLKPEQRVIQLWHACGAFKKFGQRGTNLSLRTDRATHSQYNLVTVSGRHVRKIYADAFDVDINKVKALGSARTDEFFNRDLIEQKKQKVYEKYPDLATKFVIIYAPTFRGGNTERTIFEPRIDFDRLSERLLPNQIFIICPHPVMENDIIEKKYNNIRVIRDFSTNEMMFVSDMLITDYSSVIFEYALLRKPIALYCYDLVTYDRGFYLKYPEDLPCDIYETQEELEEYLRDSEKHRITSKYEKFLQKYMSACDGHSCERIANIINSYMEET